MLFTIIDTAKAVLVSKGVYKQVDVYARNDQLFAKHGGGFIGLRKGGGTSIPNIRWDYLDGVTYFEPVSLGPVTLTEPTRAIMDRSTRQRIGVAR